MLARGGKAVCSVRICYNSRLTSFYQLPVSPKKAFSLPLMLSLPSGLLFSVLLKHQIFSSCKSHDKWVGNLGTPKGSIKISPVLDLHSLLMTRSAADVEDDLKFY